MDYAALMIIAGMFALLIAYTVIEHWWFLNQRKEENEHNSSVCDSESGKLD